MFADLKEYTVRNNRLSSFIPWFGLVAPGVILNTDGSFQQTFSYRGKDLDSSTDYELMSVVAIVNSIFKRFDDGWAVYVEAAREKAEDYPKRTFPDPLTQLMDMERRYYFNNQGSYFESRYYITIQWMPPSDTSKSAAGVFYVKDETAAQKEDERAKETLARFTQESQRFYDSFREVMSECAPLTDEETLTYLHSCVSAKRQKVAVPVTPAFLAELLCDTPLNGGLEPFLGGHADKEYLALISVTSFPPDSFPSMLDLLNRLNMEYRWVSRYITLSKNDADQIIRKLRREWFSGQKSLFTMIKETITKSESQIIETLALQRSADAEAALNELNDDMVRYGYLSSTVVLRDKDKRTLDLRVRQVMQAFQSRGFLVTQEDVNAVGAWFGTIPGQAYANVRRPMMSSLNLCHLLPLSAVWAGERMCKHMGTYALANTATSGSTPFRLNLHFGDVGHTMIVGPTGSGKSVLLNFLETQAFSFPNTRIYVFDKGGSSRVLAYALDGSFYDLGGSGSEAQSFQPLRYIDQEGERVWASEWLQQIFAQEGVTLTPTHKRDIWQALLSLSQAPAEERTLFGFWNLVQNMELKDAITPFLNPVKGITEGGPYGTLFDADKDTLTLGAYQSFEMGELMSKKNAVMPTLLYLFHVIEEHCDGNPTFIILDECWTFLDNPIFADKIREWLKTMRKNNVAIIFATQNLQDIRNCSISSAIVESCMTRIFLPNPNAMNPADEEIYRYFSLNDTERSIIARSVPKRDYYYFSPLGSRLFQLALSPFMLAYVAASTKEEQSKARELRKLELEDGTDFNISWLKYKNQPESLNAYIQCVKTMSSSVET